MSTQTNFDPEVAQMLAGLNARADMAVVDRTRRAVFLAATEMRERRIRNRRNAAIAGASLGVLIMVLTPVIWSTIEDFSDGGDFFETHSIVMVLSLVLFTTILGALLIGLRGQQGISHK